VDAPTAGTRSNAATDPTDILDTGEAGPAAIRGGAVRVVGYGIGVLLSVGSAALLFRELGVDVSGQYVTVVALIGVAQGVTDVGISALGVREMSVRDGVERHGLMRSLLGIRLVLTVLGVLGAGAFAVAVGYDRTLVLGTLVAGVGLVVQNLQGTLAIDLVSRLRFVAVTIADLVRQLVTVALVVGLVALSATLIPFLAVSIGAALGSLAVTLLALRGSRVPLRPSFRARDWGVLLRETVPFVVATAVYALYFRVAIILMSLIASEQQTGYFGASFRVVEVLLQTPALAVSAVFPIFARAARDDHERLAYGVARTFQTALVFGALLSLALALGAPFVIAVVAGEHFDPAIPMLRIEAVALGAAFVTQTFGFALLSLRRHRELLWVSLGALTLTAALTAVLASEHGGEGAAAAVAGGEVALALAIGVAFARSLPSARLPLDSLARVGVALGAGTGVALLVGGPALVMAAVGCVVYVVVVWAVGGVPAELTQRLRPR
jgi:O-antigen/teichoic acid export membrane protein